VWRTALVVGYSLFPVSLVVQALDGDATLLVLASALLMLAAVLWLAFFLPRHEEHPAY
jgi:antibiotic biosynthesis monooxygenase (ABM) superfamily enzyme